MLQITSSSSSASAAASWEPYIDRINTIIHNKTQDLCRKNFEPLHCPIEHDFPDVPVVTACGHVFNREAIMTWLMQHNGSCPECRRVLHGTPLTPIGTIFNRFLETQLPEIVPTGGQFKQEDPEKVSRYLARAKHLVEQDEDYEMALQCYKRALQYTKSSKVYAEIPRLYELWKDQERADLSLCHLSIYQLREGEVQAATQTLQKIHETLLAVEILLKCSPNAANLTWAKSKASEQDCEGRIFIYKQMLACDPCQWDLYTELLTLVADHEKRGLLTQAANAATVAGRVALAQHYQKVREEHPIQMISLQQWQRARDLLAELPPYPQALRDFLAAPCPIWGQTTRQRAEETHIVLPLISNVYMDGKVFPMTLQVLDQFDKLSGGNGIQFLKEGNGHLIPKNKNFPADQKFRYAVMTKDILPQSRNGKNYRRNKRYLESIGYDGTPPALGAAWALLWAKQIGIKHHFTLHPMTFTCCSGGQVNDCRVVISDSGNKGLCMALSFYFEENIGVAGWKVF